MKALIVTADQFEDSEVLAPKAALEAAGIPVDVAAPQADRPLHGKHGQTVLADLTLRAVRPEAYALLLLPGGKAPAQLRRDADALRIARDFFEQNKPVAAICHGPQILVSAQVLAQRRVTCYRTVAAELAGCGALYEDAPVVVDGNLVTSRQPADLPVFIREMLRLLRR